MKITWSMLDFFTHENILIPFDNAGELINKKKEKKRKNPQEF